MKFGRILIALAIALAGCSGDPAPKEPQKTTAPTPKSTATPPVMPAQAKEDSTEGIAAFVAYWVEVSNYTAYTGDVRELTRLSSPDCAGCREYIDLYRTTYESGGYFTGAEWKLGDLKVKSGSPESFATTELRYGAGKYRTSTNADEQRTKPAKEKLSFAVEGSPQSRVVSQLGLGDPE